MNNLNKLELVLKTIKDHNITAYEIGKNTKISTFAIQKIINRETKKPNERTIDLILDFLETAIVGTNYKEKIAREEPTEYITNQKTSLEKCLIEQITLYRHINYLEALLVKNNIEFDNFI